MSRLISGVTVPLVTPLTENEKLDTEGLGRLIDHVLAGGVHNLFVFGTNGEFQAFDVNELEAMVAATRQVLSQRKAQQVLLAGIGAASLREAVLRGRAAVRAGADALVACPPYYFIYKPQELQRFYLSLADQLDRPLVLYNAPRYTNNPLTPDMISKLVEHPNIIGVKDSSGNQEQILLLLNLASDHPGFEVSQGDECKLSWAAGVGVHGITPGLANVAPRMCVELWEAARNGRSADAERLQAKLEVLRGIHQIRSGISGTKAALAELGICNPTPVAPFETLDAFERVKIKEILESVGV